MFISLINQHIINNSISSFRLVGRNDQVRNVLNSIADGNTKVMVIGYPVRGPECIHLSVYHIAEVSDVNARMLGDDTFPWPWKALI